MTVVASGADFEDDVLLVLGIRSGWSLNVDASVTPFTITGTWQDETWFSIFAELVDSAGLCFTTDTLSHEADVTECG